MTSKSAVFPALTPDHLCLLRLKEDDYAYPQPTEFDWKYAGKEGHFTGTKTEQIGEWPTWDLPHFEVGQRARGRRRFSHSGWGLQLPDIGPNGERIPISYPLRANAMRGRAFR